MGLCKCRNVTNLFCKPSALTSKAIVGSSRFWASKECVRWVHCVRPQNRTLIFLFCYCMYCFLCFLLLVLLKWTSDRCQCIVKSYLQWLRNSDYDPNCALCSLPLNTSAASSILRLTCLGEWKDFLKRKLMPWYGRSSNRCFVDLFHRQCLMNFCMHMPPTTTSIGYVCPVCNVSISCLIHSFSHLILDYSLILIAVSDFTPIKQRVHHRHAASHSTRRRTMGSEDSISAGVFVFNFLFNRGMC